ncbi:adenosylcobinamide-GDP ribazoletransferase [Oscillochloris sp. ZM17-4]|uniref:adenosylcobinamide-GDP ribazoletransferase n=1 Tax=Oscillochloris sp. ZM17-4 TaxID=2866714 RepID=UPI001C734ECC|nr:adenosylcobinamide-GDP ribazoletransferase [Oscillochloris sp. ZM17-4]
MSEQNGGAPRWSIWGPITSLGEAIRFLTIIPQPWLPPASEAGMVTSIPWFPAAGAIIGALLLPAGWLGDAGWGPLARAALVVAIWGIITSGLHLDGLSDTFDAVMSWRTRERKLEIMKDSRIGAMGAIALVALMLLKFAFLAGAGPGWWRAALVAPALGRWANCYGIFWFPAAREGGLGRTFHQLVRRSDFWAASAFALAFAIIVAGPAGLVAALLVLAGSHLLIRWWVRDLGGLTGDTYGALCEIGEVVALAAITWGQ